MSDGVRLVVNGEERCVHDVVTLADLISVLGFGSAKVAVELNKEVVPRDRHAETHLSDGDRLEIVSLVGGG